MRVPTRRSEIDRLNRQTTDNYLTPAAIQKARRELDDLLKNQRRPAADEVGRTAQMGDLSENAAYQFAKQNLRRINDRITTLENRLKHAIPIDQSQSDGKIKIGSTVKVEIDGEAKTFEILGSLESNPFKGRISYSSPVGKALLGHAAGDHVEVDLNGSKRTYAIVAVE